MMDRRRFLAVAAGGLVLGAVARAPGRRAEGQPASAGAAAAGERFRVIAPGIGMDGPPARVSLSFREPFQGGAILVQAENARSGVATIFGRDYAIAAGPEGPSRLLGSAGIGVLDPPGPTLLTVTVVDLAGETVTSAHEVSIRETQWTFDDIIIPPPPPPDPNATPDPGPPLENEQPRLDELYRRVSARLWDLPWTIPIELGGDVRISGYFGEERSFNGGPRGGHHGGTDIGAPAGLPVRAANHGTVVLAELTLVRGNLVVLDHGAGVLSSYGHMESLAVSVGDTVVRGQTVGAVGTTGLSTGPHLHWEMATAGVLVDGLRWLDGTQGF